MPHTPPPPPQVYPPDPRNLSKNLHSFVSIQASCGAAVALTHSVYQTARKVADVAEAAASLFRSRGVALAWPDLTWLAVDSFIQPSAGPGEGAPLPPVQASAVAFLQYTSGSTSEPKGVTITHANLAHNLTVITRSLAASPDTVVVSWLPQYHDMGLIGAYLGTLHCGGAGFYFSPLDFIKSPPLWMQAAGRYGATHLQGPNFAYKLTARKWRERGLDASTPLGKLDLSSVRHIFNAAEPVTSAAMDTFLAAFVRYGLSPDAFHPGFGMAESTVYCTDGGRARLRVSKAELEVNGQVVPWATWEGAGADEVRAAAAQGDGAPGSLNLGKWVVTPQCPGGTLPRSGWSEVIGCGAVDKNPDVHVAIAAVDLTAPAGDPGPSGDHSFPPCPPGTVGELWVRSASVASGGYWGEPEKTRAAFSGRLVRDDSVVEPWLRSGDLAFIWEGEVFVVGRQKDMVIVRGRNHFPQDIEGSAEAAAPTALRPGCSAAFAAPLRQSLRAAQALGVQPASAPAPGQAHAEAHGEDEEGLVVVVEHREAGVGAGAAKAAAATVAAQVARDHGIRPSLVLVLKPHTAVKTTSGKIARKWNARALAALAGEGGGQAADTAPAAGEGKAEGGPTPRREPNPWAQEKGAVLAALLPEEEDKGPGAGGAGGGAPRGPRHGDLSGSALAEALQRDVGAMVGAPAAAMDTTKPLFALGLDSIALTQLGGSLAHTYGLRVSDEQVFAEGCSIVWLVNNAEALRQQVPSDPTTHIPAPAAGEGGTEIVVGAKAEAGCCQKYAPCCVCCY